MMAENGLSEEEFFHAWMQELYSSSEAKAAFHEVTFTERVCDFLVEEAVIENFAPCPYRKTSIGLKVDAYNYDEEAASLDIIVADFRGGAERLANKDLVTGLRRAIKFFEKSLNPRLHEEMEESAPAYELARLINEYSNVITKVRFILISNAFLSGRAKDLDLDSPDGYECVFDVWDLARIRRIEESGRVREDIVVDFTKENRGGLPCLAASDNKSYESYLVVMPGRLIAGLYDEYGERLLEQNVRTFLQFRSKVNKGIRNTIVNEPSMFFAFNNGITATAEEVKTKNGHGMRILSVRNLQIVNGGQTTASLYTEMKRSKNTLEGVFVQMKLSVIPGEESEDVVPRISEFANTQNKVSAADFFSNHPFHLRIEAISRRLWAPAKQGVMQDTHWYYERVRGQFLNAQAHLTPAQKKKFLIESPRSQMFNKTDLAKFEVSWRGEPHSVSLGAQKNFVRFAATVAKEWEKSDTTFNDDWFKDLVAKALLYRCLDRQIMKQSWYGGYKANIVTYTIALLSMRVRERQKEFDFGRLWRLQDVEDDFMRVLLGTAKRVNDRIQATPGGITNVTEWCKRKECWESVLALEEAWPEVLEGWVIDRDASRSRKRSARLERKLDNGIEAQIWVLKQPTPYWRALIDWDDQNQALSLKERGIVDVAARIADKLPTERQCVALVEIVRKASEEGFSSPG